MKKIFLLIGIAVVLSSSGMGQAQQYYVGVPVNDTITYIGATKSTASCITYDVEIMPVIFTLSGIDLYLVVDTISDPSGTILATPYGMAYIGDTLPLPSTLWSGGYEILLNGGFGSNAGFRLMAKGTPTVAGENYACDQYSFFMTLPTCEITLSLFGNIYCQVLNPVSVNTIEKSIIGIYPNPTTNFINVEFETPPVNTNVLIYSSTGTLVFSEQNISIPYLTINTEDITAGLYSLVIFSSDGLINTFKLIKE